ncbi:MAG: hypothetical protein HQ582_34225 [Planctomycetes bacterium]|nr:hypothetical protein [Planctomycetota bacterium]
MSKRLVHNTVSVLVSASLLVFALVPPGVRHAHDVVDGAIGKCDHGSPAAVPEVDHHHHDGLSTHPHAHVFHGPQSGPRQEVSRPTGDTWHVHFAILGLYFALPDTNLPNDRGEGASGELVFLHVARNSTPIPADGSVSDVWLPDATASGWQGDAVAPLARALRPPPVTSIPLCDSARLERTGVRLA